ncbi:MAG: hypothetical protein NTV33_05890 [Coprothermobacterota bacterium]|nr:hypothetical protein [Coprothermobacterota bacterium]
MPRALRLPPAYRLVTALVKQITGGDPLQVRFLYAEEFHFQSQCKLFFAANAKPEVRGKLGFLEG